MNSHVLTINLLWCLQVMQSLGWIALAVTVFKEIKNPKPPTAFTPEGSFFMATVGALCFLILLQILHYVAIQGANLTKVETVVGYAIAGFLGILFYLLLNKIFPKKD